MDKSEEFEWLRKRLDVVILLLMDTKTGENDSTTRKIERLMDFGFSQSDVAQILGKKLNYVTAVLATKKKSLAGKKKQQQASAPIAEGAP